MAKIMLVEDDNNLREIYEARLLAEGYDIVSAKDGEEALALAVKEKPDLIISDVMMPKISGFDMLDILRSTPETKDTKVIMMTALSQAEDKTRADKLGADRYLVKSQVTLEDVAKVAQEVLNGEEAPASEDAASPDTAAPASEAGDEPQAEQAPAPVSEPAQPPASTDPNTPNDNPSVSTASDPVAEAPVTEPTPDQTTAPTPEATTPVEPADATQPGQAGPEATPAPDMATPPQEGGEQNPLTQAPTESNPTESAAPAPAPEASDLNTQSSSDESNAVQDQIDQFVSQMPSEAPEVVEPTQEPEQATNDQAAPETTQDEPSSAPTQEQTTPELTTPEQPVVEPTEQTPEATPAPEVVPSPPEAPTQPETPQPQEPTQQTTPPEQAADNAAKLADVVNDVMQNNTEPTTSGGGSGVSGKKVISPINDPTQKPDLNKLAEEQEAKDTAMSAVPTPSATSVVNPDGSVVTPQQPSQVGESQQPQSTPGQTHQPGDRIDPHTVAL